MLHLLSFLHSIFHDDFERNRNDSCEGLGTTAAKGRGGESGGGSDYAGGVVVPRWTTAAWSLPVVRDQPTLSRALVAIHGAKTARPPFTSVNRAVSPEAKDGALAPSPW